jgi:hypothetical protein
MSRMIFDLTDDDRAALEVIRQRSGHRSQAETLRELIRSVKTLSDRATEEDAKRGAAVLAALERQRDAIVAARKPAPKPPAFKTRLKGEWKAP